MAVEVETLLFAVGISVACAFFASVGFRLFKVPDIIFLILLGVLIGPVFHLVEVGLFQSVVPLVGTVAIIIILFEGGLKIHRSELATSVGPGALLAFLVFAATALLAALAGYWVAGLDPVLALLLGMSMGGAGVVVVIPLIQQMGVQSRSQTIVSIEAAVSDVLVVLGVVGVATALQLQRTDPTELIRNLLQTFIIGIFFGAVVGLGWVQVLKTFRQRSYEYVLTIAALFLLYSGCEFLHGSGALAVLVFGLVLGNSRKTRRLAEEIRIETHRRPKRTWEWVPVFGGELANLHHEVVFFVRTFFFVSLGVVLELRLFGSARFLVLGILLAAAVVLGRYWGVRLLFSGRRTPAWDRAAVGLMFPLGLAAAVVSLIPSRRFGIPGTEDFGSYAAVAIVLTNFVAAVLVFTLSHQQREPTARAASG